MRVSEAYEAAGLVPTFEDRDFSTTCDDCGTEQRLDTMPTHDLLDITFYGCTSCARNLVGVKPFKPSDLVVQDSGIRLGDNVIGTRSELVVHAAPGRRMVVQPTPNFFE